MCISAYESAAVLNAVQLQEVWRSTNQPYNSFTIAVKHATRPVEQIHMTE